MDLDKLAQDIKTSMVFVTNLKKENEALQSRISSLEQHNSTLKALLKEKEQSHSDLLKQKDVNEKNILDKIISLQTDHRLKEDHKTLTSQHADLQLRYNEVLQSHEEQVAEMEEANEVRIKEMEQDIEQHKEKMRVEREKKEQEWRDEVRMLKDQITEVERERAEERTKVKCCFLSIQFDHNFRSENQFC
jgi:chromosome segregation ATPase